MIKILCFTSIDFVPYSNNEVEFSSYQLGNEIKSYYDAVIYDNEEYVLFDTNKHEFQPNVLKIAIVQDVEEVKTLKVSICNAWIIKNKIGNICKLIESQKDRILTSQKLYEAMQILRCMFAGNDINKKSLELILLNTKQSSSQVKNIFEDQVEEMKSIYTEIQTIKEHIKDEGELPTAGDIHDAATKTDELLTRTNDVIKALFGFVKILQSEDRISQMIDGIKNVINVGDDMLSKTKINISNDEMALLKNDFAKCFTIEEQRAIAHGETNLVKLVENREHISDSAEAVMLF